MLKLPKNLADFMLSTTPDQDQLNLFEPVLKLIINQKHSLCQLAIKINWKSLEEKLSPFYADEFGRPAKPIRLMCGLLILKQLYNLSDERIVEHWIRDAYFQYFCGESDFQWGQPCASSELVHFRERIGEEGIAEIFKQSVVIHGKKAQKEKEAFIDTTVQEKNITFPTDTKLYKKIAVKCVKIAKEADVELRQTYTRIIKKLMLTQRFRNHPRNYKKAISSGRKLKTIAGRLCRDLTRKSDIAIRLKYQDFFQTTSRILNQNKKDSNKIYSLHEPDVYCIAKGKEAKKYEFGAKAAIMWGKKTGVIVGVKNIKKNVHDSKVIEPLLESVEKMFGYFPKKLIGDRGFRGVTSVNGTEILIPKNPSKKASRYDRIKARSRFRQRAGIEPVIGHLKSDYRLSRNYLSGQHGDTVNLLMAAASFNFRKWIRELEDFLSYFPEAIFSYLISVRWKHLTSNFKYPLKLTF